MRQDEKFLLLHGLHNAFGEVGWIDHTIDRGDALLPALGHRGAHRLRAQDGNLYAPRAIFDGKPFGKGNGGMFRYGIRR